MATRRARQLSHHIPRRYREAGFDRYPANAIDADAVAEARRYCDEIDDRLDRGEGIWFIGPKGTGKTTLAMIISKHALKAQRSVAIYTAPVLLAHIAATYEQDAHHTYLQFMDRLAAVAADYSVDATLPAPGFREAVKQITGGGANVVFDPVGGDVFDESTRCIAFGGRLLVIGFTSGRIASVATNIPLIKGFSVIGVRAGEYGRRFPDKGRENQDAVWALAAEGRIRPRVDSRYKLADWRRAFEAMRDSRMIGKIVIEP